MPSGRTAAAGELRGVGNAGYSIQPSTLGSNASAALVGRPLSSAPPNANSQPYMETVAV
jgi:hypothetical protein